jgi:hypothetical protein
LVFAKYESVQVEHSFRQVIFFFSFNPRSNRDSGSSDESSEQGGAGQTKSSTSGEGVAPQTLTTNQQRKAFFIARELMSSERVFVDVLKLLNVEFREYLQVNIIFLVFMSIRLLNRKISGKVML